MTTPPSNLPDLSFAQALESQIQLNYMEGRINPPYFPHQSIPVKQKKAHQLENGVNIRHIQELLGYHSIKTTEIYTHISKVAKEKIANPLDQL